MEHVNKITETGGNLLYSVKKTTTLENPLNIALRCFRINDPVCPEPVPECSYAREVNGVFSIWMHACHYLLSDSYYSFVPIHDTVGTILFGLIMVAVAIARDPYVCVFMDNIELDQKQLLQLKILREKSTIPIPDECSYHTELVCYLLCYKALESSKQKPLDPITLAAIYIIYSHIHAHKGRGKDALTCLIKANFYLPLSLPNDNSIPSILLQTNEDLFVQLHVFVKRYILERQEDFLTLQQKDFFMSEKSYVERLNPILEYGKLCADGWKYIYKRAFRNQKWNSLGWAASEASKLYVPEDH
eukprot:TRINITY_DN19854_c0_g1_i1.p1 TRINITY_DN19854_c0_g1~~TRINITY_DN19854_c0_g1_i1.p1  ORF type:complete len:351 (+),score=15.75 TRINITY_DN19854_c0_g1_i1:150-1055(+)